MAAKYCFVMYFSRFLARTWDRTPIGRFMTLDSMYGSHAKVMCRCPKQSFWMRIESSFPSVLFNFRINIEYRILIVISCSKVLTTTYCPTDVEITGRIRKEETK
jgi:hypothetical protein